MTCPFLFGMLADVNREAHFAGEYAMHIKKLSCVFMMVGSLMAGERVTVDKIVARVSGRTILLSDITQPRIDNEGKPYTLEQAIDNELLYQKAEERKLLPTPLEIEKYIAQWKEMHNASHLSEEEFEKRLRQDGLTSEKYRQQLKKVLAVKNLRQMEVSEQAVVTTREVEAYHQKNPEVSKDRYLLQTKVVTAEHEADVAPLSEKVAWIDVNWIESADLAEQMKFVVHMKEGEISKPVKVPGGYQLIKLVKKEKGHLKKLDERWSEIEKILQDERMKKFEKEFLRGLKATASIILID
jgi:hypothetical protein